jgi:putative transposase
MWIEPNHRNLSIRRQCELLGLNRSTYYLEPAAESEENLELMRVIDRQYTETPFFGRRQMTEFLRQQGWQISENRVRRLMGLLGLRGLAPGPRNTSVPHPDHVIYPYLLRGLTIDRPNQVWASDITYVPLKRGFVYLAAVIDWYSRFVLAWRLSNTLDRHFCVAVLEDALLRATPEIVNTDQGAQFTSADFVETVLGSGAKMSMDGRGRALDNVIIERLWRTVKYEDIYLHGYEWVPELVGGLTKYFGFYNSSSGGGVR